MDNFIFVLEYEDAHGKPVTSISTFSDDTINLNIEGDFLVVSIKESVSTARFSVVQKIILPCHKVIKAELLDFTSPKCPPEYVELALMQMKEEEI